MVAPDNLMESPMDRPASKGTNTSTAQTNRNEQTTDEKEQPITTEVHKQPSYVALACCISGYTTLSYDSKQRQQNLRSRPVSPIRPESFQNVMYTSECGKYLLPEPSKLNQNMQTEGKGLDVLNGCGGLHSPRHVANITLAQDSRSFNTSIVTSESFSCSTRFSRTTTSSFTTASSTTTTNGDSSSTSRLITPTKITDQLSPSSFIVQRVERLYGPGALAQGFYSPRKLNNTTKITPNDFNLSRNSTTEDSQNEQSLPVLKLLRPEFRAQLTVANRKLRTISIPEKLSSPYEDIIIKSEEKRKNSSDQVDAAAVHFVNNDLIQPSQQIEIKDGHYFLKILKEHVDRLEKLAETAEKELIELDNEEGSGILRAVSGKARLLVAQKLKQFEGLCLKNIKQSNDEDFPTTNEDLAGFWDMVMIQINEVLKQFEQIEQLRKNNWKNIESIIAESERNSNFQTPNTKSQQIPRNSSKVATRKGINTISGEKNLGKVTPVSAAAKARDEARRKMIEERRKAMKQQQQQQNNEGINKTNSSRGGDAMFVL